MTIVLITGANSGIGFEAVKALAVVSFEFHVLLGSRSIEKGQQALNEIYDTLGDSIKATISVSQIDVCDKISIVAAKGQIQERFGKLDALINNAGIIVYQKIDIITSLRRTFETNVFGQLIVTETLEDLLKKAAKPYVIYISSELGSVTSRCNPEYHFYHVREDHYRMSKAALNVVAACHHYNYADWGCKVLSFNPGWWGARDPRDPAILLVDILLGKRDEDVEKNGMMDIDGGILPW
ncbi:putative short chain dehydrogenase/reductase [Xylaria nigripes]|nr:putative short chain dehydrogenase/reductase [Xylaria nigripes]